MSKPVVDFVVRQMSDEVLRRDGGHAKLLDLTSEGVAIVEFAEGTNDDCADCVMSEEDFSALLLERIQWKVPQVHEVRLVTS